MRREALLIGYALEQVVELAALGFRERGEQGGLVLAGDQAEGDEHVAAIGGEVEGMAAAVVLIAAALDEAAGVQRVEQGNEAAGNHLEASREGLLRDARCAAEDAQDPGMRGREADGQQALGEARGGVAADLGEKESGVAAGLGGPFGPAGFFHRIIITSENRSALELF
ncbi:MAG TPA: hypothetical protein VJS11_08325 [Acidobacteriaceae bacterium]|nr:hypothetical protein [Acidobacteriaceae bacterium]